MEDKIPNISLMQFSVIWTTAIFPPKHNVFKKILLIIIQLTNIHTNNANAKMLTVRFPKSPFNTREKYPAFQSSFVNYAIGSFKMHSISVYTFRPTIFSDNFSSDSLIIMLWEFLMF